MSAVVTRSSPVTIVRPSSEPPTGGGSSSRHVDLSPVDGCYASLPVTCVLVMEHPIDHPVETIKAALSQALVHYGPIAGRLADNCRRIACTGEGVSFVGASANCTLQLLTLQMSDLALQYPGELCADGDPLLLMQVTEFSCGGYTVGVTWNHAVADGDGMAQFLQAVGELARGMPAPSVMPLRSTMKLPVIPAATAALHSSTMELVGLSKHLATLDFTVPGSLIRRMKAEHGCTVYEALAAVLWRCRTRAAAIADPEAAAPLAIPCNARRHLGTEAGYYGNCLAMAFVNATAGAVAGGEMGDLLGLIRSAKEKAHHQDNVLSLGTPPSTVDEMKALMYNMTCVVSWRNLGFDGADFGHGTPARVMWHMERVQVAFCAACPPCKGVDGVNVMSRCVWPEHVDAFLAELASM